MSVDVTKKVKGNFYIYVLYEEVVGGTKPQGRKERRELGKRKRSFNEIVLIYTRIAELVHERTVTKVSFVVQTVPRSSFAKQLNGKLYHTLHLYRNIVENMTNTRERPLTLALSH